MYEIGCEDEFPLDYTEVCVCLYVCVLKGACVYALVYWFKGLSVCVCLCDRELSIFRPFVYVCVCLCVCVCVCP